MAPWKEGRDGALLSPSELVLVAAGLQKGVAEPPTYTSLSQSDTTSGSPSS